MINNRWLLLGSLLMFALVLNREGDRMPTANEFIYLLYFYKAWHPHFLATDWTMQETSAGHAVFNYATGWLAVLMSLKAAAWLGRVVCWTATIIGLFRVGRHFKLQPWAVWTGIVLWLLQRQSQVTGEWMLGSFEAKTIAYPCLLFAIDAVLSNRLIRAGVLCGIAFSFHSAVGMWGGAALGMSVLLFNPIRKTAAFSIATILFSLPGLITSLPLIVGKNAITLEQARFLTIVALPNDFDPAGFPHTWMAIMLLLIPAFAWLHARWRAGDRAIQQLLVFEIMLLIFFISGVIARFIGRYDWVELFPMRVYAVFGLLLFFWQAMTVAVSFMQPGFAPADRSRLRWLAVFGVFICLSMPSPILQLRDMVGGRLVKRLHPSDLPKASPRGEHTDFLLAAKWINTNTGATDIVIAPPWWNDSFYFMDRPLIANWHAPRYDRMAEWKIRIEAMVGDTSDLTFDDALGGEMNGAAWSHYANLSTADVTQLRQLYGGRWLVTTGNYPYRIAYSTNTYLVYDLPPLQKRQSP